MYAHRHLTNFRRSAVSHIQNWQLVRI